MLKLITITLALGAFVLGAMATNTHVYAGCTKAPKHYVPCTKSVQGPHNGRQ